MLLTKGRSPNGGLPFMNPALPKSEAVFSSIPAAALAQRRNPKRFQLSSNQTNSIPVSATRVACARPNKPQYRFFHAATPRACRCRPGRHRDFD
jgi:hypothetical protein